MKFLQIAFWVAGIGHCASIATEEDGSSAAVAVDPHGDLNKISRSVGMRMLEFMGRNYISAAVSRRYRDKYLKYSQGKTETAITQAALSISTAEDAIAQGFDALKILSQAIRWDKTDVVKRVIKFITMEENEGKLYSLYIKWQVAKKRNDPCLDAKSLLMVQCLRAFGFCYDESISVLAAIRNDFDSLNWLKETDSEVKYKEIAEWAFKHNDAALVDWLVESAPEHSFTPDDTACVFAARQGRIDILKWNYRNTGKCTSVAYDLAIEHNHPEILNLLESEKGEFNSLSACREALKKGSISMLEWIYGKGENCDSTIYVKSMHYGHPAVFDWATKREIPLRLSEVSCKEAALDGAHVALEWFRQRSQNCAPSTFVFAIGEGQLEFLKWVERTYPELQIPFSDDETVIAAGSGHLETLQWAEVHCKDVPFESKVQDWYWRLFHSAALGGRQEVAAWVYGKVIDASRNWINYVANTVSLQQQSPDSARFDQLFKWACANGASVRMPTLKFLIQRNRHELVHWIVKSGQKMKEMTILPLIKWNRLDLFKLAVSNSKVQLTLNSCYVAKAEARLDFLDFIVGAEPGLRKECLKHCSQKVEEWSKKWAAMQYEKFGIVPTIEDD